MRNSLSCDAVGLAETSAVGPAPVHVRVGVDLLLADLVGHRHLIGHGLGVEPDPLHGYSLLLHDGPLLAENDLVLFLTDGWTRGGIADVGVGDRLALDADLFALHRNGLLDVLGGGRLIKTNPAGL